MASSSDQSSQESPILAVGCVYVGVVCNVCNAGSRREATTPRTVERTIRKICKSLWGLPDLGPSRRLATERERSARIAMRAMHSRYPALSDGLGHRRGLTGSPLVVHCSSNVRSTPAQETSTRPILPTRTMHAIAVTSRRDLVAVTLSAAVLLVADRSRAEDVAGAAVPSPAANVVPLKPKLFIARDFLFAYPRGWRVIEDTENGDSLSDRRRQNVVRGEVVSPDGVTVSVIQQQASKLKQSLTTITDLKQLGTAQEVSKLVLPPGTTVYSTTTRSIPVPPKDTGISGVGVIERDPVTIYRYSVRLSNGVRSEIAVGILLGRVLILGAGFQEGIDGEQQSSMVRT